MIFLKTKDMVMTSLECSRCHQEEDLNQYGLCKSCNQEVDLEYSLLYTVKTMEY